MIGPLRTAHRATFIVLALSLPILLAGAIASRKPTRAAELAPKQMAATETLGEFRFLFNGERVSLSLNHFTAEPGGRYTLRSELAQTSLPETLLFWTSAAAKDAVPFDAALIGPIVIDRPFTMAQNYASSGSLLLYDAPHKRILAQLSLEHR